MCGVGAHTAQPRPQTSHPHSSGRTHGATDFMDPSASRGALLLSGHLRDTCRDAQVRRGLLEQVDQCRTAFRGACDVFLHSWDMLDAAEGTHTRQHEGGRFPQERRELDAWPPTPQSASSSYDCLQELSRAITFAAVSIETQRPRHSVALRHATALWGTSGRSVHGVYMNLMGQVGALQLMQRHAEAMRITYHAAVRMRVDSEAPRVAALTRARPPWAIISQGASDVAQGARQTAVPLPAIVYACSTNRSLGSPASDNCYWSAPPSSMARLLLPFAREGEFEARAADTNRSCLKAAHPESLLRCALGRAGVMGRPSPTSLSFHTM